MVKDECFFATIEAKTSKTFLFLVLDPESRPLYRVKRIESCVSVGTV